MEESCRSARVFRHVEPKAAVKLNRHYESRFRRAFTKETADVTHYIGRTKTKSAAQVIPSQTELQTHPHISPGMRGSEKTCGNSLLVHLVTNTVTFRACLCCQSKARSAVNGRPFTRNATPHWQHRQAPFGRAGKRSSAALFLLERDEPFPARHAWRLTTSRLAERYSMGDEVHECTSPPILWHSEPAHAARARRDPQ